MNPHSAPLVTPSLASAVHQFVRGIRRTWTVLTRKLGDEAYIVAARLELISARLNVPPDPYPHLRRRAAEVRVQIRVDTVAERREWRRWLEGQRTAARQDLRLAVAVAEIRCGVADYTPPNVIRGSE